MPLKYMSTLNFLLKNMSINIYARSFLIKQKKAAFSCFNIKMYARKTTFILTMSYPAMFALVTCSQVDLSRLETLTCAVHQSAANGLQKHTRNVAVIYKINANRKNMQ